MRDPSVFHALVLMHLLFAAALWALLRPSVRAAVACAVVAIAWVIWNGPIEGAVLVSFTPDHGITESDVLGAVALVIAGATVVRARR
ncbi:hypothetical protein [Williamsia serinedens]|uniref:Uncharacterized protein n=1 Tax=Williamsia serinedens TaxID=391736 RepID=A0ABT1H4L0_9NOCA|nr:hypothetical protein [Williamsia serinedens]MCP2161904.1 hypothetical protein [Williamsia serinedens]